MSEPTEEEIKDHVAFNVLYFKFGELINGLQRQLTANEGMLLIEAVLENSTAHIKRPDAKGLGQMAKCSNI